MTFLPVTRHPSPVTRHPSPVPAQHAMPIETVLPAAARDLGDGFVVRRALPAAKRMMVGPFIFFDHFGPTSFAAGSGLDVRPHPHVGLATVTYLFEGEILHRDSLGVVQPIRPGEVNWMIAGRGIAHSERSPPEVRASGGPMSGIQLWLALPKRDEEIAPAFLHYDRSQLPNADTEGVQVRVIAGTLDGIASPVRVFSPMFYVQAEFAPGARFSLGTEHADRAIYVAEGAIVVDGKPIGAGNMIVLTRGTPVTIAAASGARVLLLGGEPLDEPRHIWWNFVSSSRERIRQAKDDWQLGRFLEVPGDLERIAAPERGP